MHRRLKEKPAFRLGARVRSLSERVCGDRHYLVKDGKIIRIKGPMPYDPEWMLKGVGPIWGDHPPSRVYWYEVEYLCPWCRRKKSAMFFGPQLAPLH